jgi:protein FAM50
MMNKTLGPGGKLLFDYSTDAPPVVGTQDNDEPSTEPLFTAASRASKSLPDISTLEGATGDASFTKVVDRRWYERNKHIYPASVWQELDPEKDYQNEVRRDLGGNTFFYK